MYCKTSKVCITTYINILTPVLSASPLEAHATHTHIEGRTHSLEVHLWLCQSAQAYTGHVVWLSRTYESLVNAIEWWWCRGKTWLDVCVGIREPKTSHTVGARPWSGRLAAMDYDQDPYGGYDEESVWRYSVVLLIIYHPELRANLGAVSRICVNVTFTCCRLWLCFGYVMESYDYFDVYCKGLTQNTGLY